MEAKRQNPDGVRITGYIRGGIERRDIFRNLSLRVSNRRLGIVRYQSDPMDGQKIGVENMREVEEVTNLVEIEVPVQSKIRKWAFENAYTLIFIAGFFVITWILTVVVAYATG